MSERITLFSLILVLALGSIAFGQTTTKFGLEFSYDSNAYRTYNAVPDYLTETSFSIARDMAPAPWSARIFYDGNLNFFSQDSDLRFHDHTVGLAASRSLPWGDGILGLGGNLSLSRNAALYEYANYGQGLGYANARFQIGQSSANQFGYRLRYRRYENLPEFSNLESYVFERVNFPLSMGTSLILQTSIGRKSYSSTQSGSSSPQMPTHGHGHRGWEDSEGDWWMESGDSSATTTPPVSQWTGSVRVGQSITASTGLGIHYLRRVNLGGEVRSPYPYDEVYNYRSEDELFNDPYSYEGHEAGAELTRLLPVKMSLKLGYDYYTKNYTYAARDLEGRPLATGENRSDTQGVVWMNLSKTFTGKGALNGFQVYTEVQSIANESNDPYFDYDGTVVSLGTSLSF